MPERRAEKRKQKRREQRALQRQLVLPNVQPEPILNQPEISTAPLPSPTRGKNRFALAMALGAVDLFSRNYGLHQTEFLSSYGHDVLSVPVYWLLSQSIFSKSEFFRSKKNILVGTALSAGFEGYQYLLLQRVPEFYEQPVFGNRYAFDPNDFIAYGLGAIAAFGLHQAFYGRDTQKKESLSYESRSS
ncbi:MAG: hypothetical protein Q7S88_01075 [Candidatus Daviesbacteria bacterium]|nr:hypothetical protein [Candidatus Daviesbacteria bacterium]